MRYVKILGLAAIAAAALMAFVGAGTASAETTLCTETNTPTCEHFPLGTEVHAVLEPEEKAILTPEGELPTIECGKSTIKGTLKTTTTPEIELHEEGGLTFEECSQTVEVLNPGKLQVHWENEHNGTITAKGFRVRVKAFFGSFSCDFGEEVSTGLTLTGGNTATVDATAKIPVIQETGFVACPANAIWHAKYLITSPDALYVKNDV
jgi:hypothetical protein